ncbi:MAG: hypothetical protein ACLFMT_06340 [Halobacteriales archaeon]
MTARSASRKVEGGKLVRVSVDFDGAVSVTGDFFVHPEEVIDEVEVAVERGLESGDVENAVERVVEEGDVELLGFDVEVLAELAREAAE